MGVCHKERGEKMIDAWDVEQRLQDANVFVSGINDRPCHMDSYMTVIDFQKLFPAIDAITEEVDWKKVCEYWIGNNYLTPIQGLLGLSVKRHKGIE